MREDGGYRSCCIPQHQMKEVLSVLGQRCHQVCVYEEHFCKHHVQPKFGATRFRSSFEKERFREEGEREERRSLQLQLTHSTDNVS